MPEGLTSTVFIDFDGTLADHGVIPDAHLSAMAEARTRGHQVVLCTGRPRSMVLDTDAALFDGLVCAAGGYVEWDGRLLADRRFPPDLGARAVELLEANDSIYVLEAPDAGYVPAGMPERIRRLFDDVFDGALGETSEQILDSLVVVDDPAGISFGKATCFWSSAALTDIAAELGPGVALIPSSLTELGAGAGEMYLADVTKAVGIEVVADHFGLAREQIVAIGDGFNDVEMLQHAATAVAIEGAPAEVLELADLIVPPPSRNGVASAFAQLGLIG